LTTRSLALPFSHGIHFQVSLDYYRRESLKILSIFSEACPIIEKAALDEAFLDLTSSVIQRLLESFPHLREAPDGRLDAPLPPPPPSHELSWEGNLIPVGDSEEPGYMATWGDVALCTGARIMTNCRRNIKERLGYTCSAGISKNKMLSKLCSAWKKPDDQVSRSHISHMRKQRTYLLVITRLY
jgi:DNA polymerase eta